MREWEESLQQERELIEHAKKAHDKAFNDPMEEGKNDININNFDDETRNVKKLDMSLFSKFKQENVEQVPVRKSSVKKEVRSASNSNVVTVKTVTEVESTPVQLTPEEEYELKRRSVGKLNKDWMSQMYQQDSNDAEQRRRETEMQRVKQEQYEIIKLQNEEAERLKQQKDEVFNDNETNDKPQNVKRLDENAMYPFQKSGISPVSKKKNKDEIRQERKLARKESRSKMKPEEVIQVEMTTEVQSSYESLDGPQANVGRLDKGRYLQMMGEDMSDKERRKKQLEEERVRRELEEMERQREEELRRQQQDSDEERSNYVVTDKPQSVSKIDLSQFSQFQQKNTVIETPRKTSIKKESPKQREQEVEIVQSTVTKEVHSAPYSYEDDEIVIEEKRKTVGKLDLNKITKSFTDEADEKRRRLIELEKERIRREEEERELLLREQRKYDDDYVVKESSVQEAQSSPTSFDDERTVEVSEKKSVGKLDFNKITQSFSDEAEEKRRRLIEMEKERIRREEEERQLLLLEKERQRKVKSVTKEDNYAITETTVQDVHSAPVELTEDQAYEEKRKSVGKLDFGKITKSFGEEAEEKRNRLLEMEKERIRREKEERDILLQERSRKSQEVVMQENTVQEVHSALTNFDDEMAYEEKIKTNVGKLDFQKITKSFGDEAESKRQRLIELEKERIRREKEERDLLLQEQERQRKKESVVQESKIVEVESAPENDRTTVEDKPKSVGKLDFNKITKSFGDEAEEKRNRLVEMERERIRRENEEREILAREKQNQRNRTSVKRTEEIVQETSAADVHSAPTEMTEDQEYEEKRKSVGKLDFNKITKSFGDEAEEKRQRLIELERERIRREKEEKELLSRERKQADDDNDYQSEQSQNDEKTKQSVNKLNIGNIMQSFHNEDEMKRQRALELEKERRLRDEEEKLRSRQLERERAHKTPNTVRLSVAHEVESAPTEDIFFEEKPSKADKEVERKTSKSDRERKESAGRRTNGVVQSQTTTRYDYEDGGPSKSNKSIGKLDMSRFSQSTDQESRERERRSRENEIEILRLERDEMDGRDKNMTSER